MARIDDLVAEIPDRALREELEAVVRDTKKRQRYGLVYEEHVPETVALPRYPIQQGALVQRKDGLGGKIFRVESLSEGDATLVALGDNESTSASPADLVAVKRFGDPIYPGLRSVGSIHKGETDRCHHALISAENFHALQLLGYAFEGKADCIYIDPPYNTGARDWKYNNRYVDSADGWRYSKWLSFMEKRLRLARRLLKPDSVLIVTIDEHEVNHLGVLLEQVFPDAYRQMVTIVINPKGVTQERFSRTEEYAFFCFFGKAAANGLGDDLLTPLPDDEDSEGLKPRWKGLLRSGTNARREDRKNMFFPVLVDPKRKAVLGTGDPLLPVDREPNRKRKIKGLVPVWPIRKDGSYGNWGVGHHTLRRLIDQGYVKVGDYDPKRDTWGISYLSRKLQEQIEGGILVVDSYDEQRNLVDVSFTDPAMRRVKTVWHRSSHDAGSRGADLLRSFHGGERRFPFPKSLYAVRDSLAAVVGHNPDALIIDFFAGSGTTLHATALLNAQLGGSRRCIMVTNNEVDPETAAKLARDDHFPGDDEYEAKGIFEHVTRPRIEAAISGVDHAGQPVAGSYLDGRLYSDGFSESCEFFRLEYLDPDDVELGLEFASILPILWMASGCKGAPPDIDSDSEFAIPSEANFGVLFRESRFRQFRQELRARPDVTHAWLVTDSEEAFAEMSSELPRGVTASMLYRDYLRNFRVNTERALWN